MKLDDWMDLTGTDSLAVAGAVGKTRSTVNRWRAGTVVPALRDIRKVQHFTKGAVTAADWTDPAAERQAAASATDGAAPAP